MDPVFNCALFQGIEEKEARLMLKCLDARKRLYPKGSVIFHIGDTTDSLGLLLSGSIHLLKEDLWGSQQIIAHIAPGQIFGEVYACMKEEAFPFRAAAAEDCQILFLNVKRVLTTCTSSCAFHSRLIQNLLFVLASKNLSLNRKIDYLTPKSIRDRVLAYLSDEALRQGQTCIKLPFNRQQLADYLCVERSALSKELSKMRKDGLISYRKNEFRLSGASLHLLPESAGDPKSTGCKNTFQA